MSEQLYRIRLYGHSGENREQFVKSLSTVLGIEYDEADGILRSVPVVVRSGLFKDQADQIQKLLSAIKALSLIETEVSDELGGAAQFSGTVPSHFPESVTGRGGPPSGYRKGLTLVIGIIGLALVLLALLLGAMLVDRAVPELPDQAVSTSGPTGNRPSQQDEGEPLPSVEELQMEITQVRNEALTIKARLMAVENELATLFVRNPGRPVDRGRKGNEARSLRAKLYAKLRELKVLERELKWAQEDMESEKAAAHESPSGYPSWDLTKKQGAQ